jgi:hypothetical protein
VWIAWYQYYTGHYPEMVNIYRNPLAIHLIQQWKLSPIGAFVSGISPPIGGTDTILFSQQFAGMEAGYTLCP